MRALKIPPRFVPLIALCFATSLFAGQDISAYRRHDDPQWATISAHLPDPATATVSALEQQADLLRIRRFPEDALDYYMYAVKRGGRSAMLLDKIGLTQLELRNVVLAEGYFRQAIRLDRRSPLGWNNLAAMEYMQRQYGAAVSDYKKAVKLDRKTAVFHANLSTAYFETKDYKRARAEADEALHLDPLVFQHTNGAGVAAHILSVEDRARFAFEMAKLYAQRGDQAEMLHSLGVACENGMDIRAEMVRDKQLIKYKDDPRVMLLIVTAETLRPGKPALVANATPRTESMPTQR